MHHICLLNIEIQTCMQNREDILFKKSPVYTVSYLMSLCSDLMNLEGTLYKHYILGFVLNKSSLNSCQYISRIDLLLIYIALLDILPDEQGSLKLNNASCFQFNFVKNILLILQLILFSVRDQVSIHKYWSRVDLVLPGEI